MASRDDVDRLLDWGGVKSEALKKIKLLIEDPFWRDDTPIGLLDAIEEALEDANV